MTEQMIEKIDTTITHLEGMVRAAESREEMEAFEYAKKRDHMVKVAHQRGTDNSIGEALDDLLEEFDLPRRPWRGTIQFLIEISRPVQEWRSALITPEGNGLYWTPGSRVVQVSAASISAFLYPDTTTCLCGNLATHGEQWAREYIGRDMSGVRFRVANPNCGHNNCVNRDRPAREQATYLGRDAVASFDFGDAPFHTVEVPAT